MNPITSSITVDRYAIALYKVVASTLKEEAEMWLNILNKEALFAFYKNLGISKDVKKESLNTLNISPKLKSFLILLLDNGRPYLIQRCLEAYLQIIKVEQGEATVTITTTIPLPLEQQHIILGTLIEKFTNINPSKIKVENIIDPALLGGFIVNFNNTRIDYSIRSQLEKFITTSKAAISNI